MNKNADLFLKNKLGVYGGIPEDVYHAKSDAISNSGLGRIKRSPAHFKFGGEGGQSDALLFGRAFHAALLTPAEFQANYVTFDGDRRTAAGKAQYADLMEKHAGSVMKAGDMDTILQMRLSAMENPVAQSLLSVPGDPELTILWNCEGVLAKSRIDKYIDKRNEYGGDHEMTGGGILVDLKTTRNAHPDAFSKSIYQYGYHRQAAFYLYAARTMGLTAHRFVFIAIEKERPYGVAVYELTQEALSQGLSEALDLVAVYRTCLASNQWPAYGTDIIEVGLPTWAQEEIGEPEM